MAAEMCMNEKPDARKLRVCGYESHTPAASPVNKQAAQISYKTELVTYSPLLRKNIFHDVSK